MLWNYWKICCVNFFNIFPGIFQWKWKQKKFFFVSFKKNFALQKNAKLFCFSFQPPPPLKSPLSQQTYQAVQLRRVGTLPSLVHIGTTPAKRRNPAFSTEKYCQTGFRAASTGADSGVEARRVHSTPNPSRRGSDPCFRRRGRIAHQWVDRAGAGEEGKRRVQNPHPPRPNKPGIWCRRGTRRERVGAERWTCYERERWFGVVETGFWDLLVEGKIIWWIFENFGFFRSKTFFMLGSKTANAKERKAFFVCSVQIQFLVGFPMMRF